MEMRSNNGPEQEVAAVSRAIWPVSRLGEAIHTLARCAGLPTTCSETFAPSPDLPSEQLNTWIEAAADRGGILASQAVTTLADMPSLTVHAARDTPPLAVAGLTPICSPAWKWSCMSETCM